MPASRLVLVLYIHPGVIFLHSSGVKTMSKPLWTPSRAAIEKAQMTVFRREVNEHYHLHLEDYHELYTWSVTEPADFWESFYNFSDLLTVAPYTQVVDDPTKMPGARWFQGSRLNFAENLLRFRDDQPALIFKGEGQPMRTVTYRELYTRVGQMQTFLREIGVQKGDRVAGFLPNLPETVIAMLATASLGAIWSSSSPDFGIKGVLDRFSQIQPKVLFSADGYFYNGKAFHSLAKLQGIYSQLPSVERLVIVPYLNPENPTLSLPNSILFDDCLKLDPTAEPEFVPLPFDHPLYIMYSSGTTGLPKSIVHGAGGTLLQHLKELRLHTDLRREDTIFYFTTCGWMMWNWLVSSLAVGATVVLYDGSPFHPRPAALWDLAQEVNITVFGTSAKYIAACEAAGVKPRETHQLPALRAILSTGSPLVEESFDYVYRDIKEDLLLASISGGTDIISCFALGNPTLPVYRGELQCRGLGMKVAAYNPQGKSVTDEKGELVCELPFPSMPIYFWNDPEGKKYRAAYFEKFPGVWTHGDFISINDHGGVQIFGRSDATLNPGGVRIGTAEIYRVVEALPEVADSLVVGQNWRGDERVILFLKLSDGVTLTQGLIEKIKRQIRTQCSPRHVPAITLPIADIPYTINGKKVELAVKKIIHGEKVLNRDALANPEALEYYRDLPELQT